MKKIVTLVVTFVKNIINREQRILELNKSLTNERLKYATAIQQIACSKDVVRMYAVCQSLVAGQGFTMKFKFEEIKREDN